MAVQLDHERSRAAFEAERDLVRRLGGDCSLPLGAYAEERESGIRLMAVVIAYYYGVARVGGDFIQSAFTGTALLIGSRSRCSGWACG